MVVLQVLLTSKQNLRLSIKGLYYNTTFLCQLNLGNNPAWTSYGRYRQFTNQLQTIHDSHRQNSDHSSPPKIFASPYKDYLRTAHDSLEIIGDHLSTRLRPYCDIKCVDHLLAIRRQLVPDHTETI